MGLLTGWRGCAKHLQSWGPCCLHTACSESKNTGAVEQLPHSAGPCPC